MELQMEVQVVVVLLISGLPQGISVFEKGVSSDTQQLGSRSQPTVAKNRA